MNILYRIVGEDFVFQSPTLMEESGKKIELTDFLVLLDDILITIQSKSIDIDIDDINLIKLGRIFKKYENAKSQLNRTVNSSNRKEKVILNAKHLEEHIELPWVNFRTKISIITLNIPDNLYENPEFRFQFTKFEIYKGMALHIFILQDLQKVCDEMKTGGDLLHYLENREIVLKAVSMQHFVNELDIMAVYKTKYDAIEKIRKGEIDELIIEPGLWEFYVKEHAARIIERDKLLAECFLIDILIKENRNSISYSIEKYGYTKNEMIQSYMRIIGILNSLTAIERYNVEMILKEKLTSTDIYPMRYFIFPFRKKAIFFLITNETDRERRTSQLQGLSEQAALHLSKGIFATETFLGVATEGRKAPGRSFDSILFNPMDIIDEIKEFDGILFENRNLGKVDEWTL
ncbi:hypothetical protein EHQ13_16370 [Leptospira gomenensis]|uniref:Uncharacterized protein n=1 Tax=Leptospira gomenensis TaxID=2484974 RepID=A0A5F1YF87_9LEPT|nr:hypothetical protein [Leptospira gomenensis]TGK38478.1 hypothetical protein EHQ17_02255 [Leptospira gomenensis]TGK42593.1 hypothetical protein EHQ07_14350 [Leptospira gomenensis]TGK55841.1 hypothetical protein EHQ13_16370 [Leptospira gomenensis]